MKPAPFARDAEGSDGVPVEVGEQGEVEIESLRPSDVAPSRVAGGRYRADADLFELVAPVTQELYFDRSSSAPIKQVEQKQERPSCRELGQGGRLVRLDP